ncbi:MAG TPA: glycosyltransferase family 4 protein [Terriglobales bacterium]|nr:glycosyltransferase family 4 protein [Terriglobales bacterium]
MTANVRLSELAAIENPHSISVNSWVAVFAGARDGYQVPIALEEAGRLNALVTDFYSPLDRPFVRNAVRLLPSSVQSKLSRRFSSNLPSRLVRSRPLYALKTWRNPQSWTEHVALLGEAAGRIATEHGSGLLAYSHVASAAFAQAPQSTKVLFQMQPHPASVREALTSDKFMPEFADAMNDERTWPAQVFMVYAREPLLADLCLAASSYTRQTLIENGVAANHIAVVPYGVDLEFFTPGQEIQEKFTVLFVGQLVRQKGLHYLLEAWRRLKLPNAELRIVGSPGSKRLKEYSGDATFLGTLEKDELRTEYRRADLLCLPSLSDGFGLVVLEALACGTPVLATSTCGASDLIRDSANGFVIPPADLARLMERLEWTVRNRPFLRDMRSEARKTAELYPWSRFRQRLVNVVESITAD